MSTERQFTGRTIPSHIDPLHIVDYDVYHDRRYGETGDLHDTLYRLAEEVGRGVFWTPHNGGHWFINDHELLFEAARKPEFFSSKEMTIPPMPEEPRLIPLFTDGAVHAAYRQPLMKEFSLESMKKLQKNIRDFAVELIEEIAPQGRCDFVEDFAEPFPVKIFMKLMGMPLERLREFRGWVFDMLSDDDQRRASSYANIGGLMDELMSARRLKPEDDLITRLLSVTIDGRPVSHEELQAYCLLLFAAGLDTVANSLAFGVNYLARHPEIQDRLRATPEAIPEAVEEFLRRFGVAMPARTATRDIDFGGVRIKKGERVMLMLPAGNLDPKVFSNPQAFDLDRENKVHITFNVGPHRCIGSHLARIELRTFYEEWLQRMPNVHLDPDNPVVYRTGLTLAMQKVPILWDVKH